MKFYENYQLKIINYFITQNLALILFYLGANYIIYILYYIYNKCCDFASIFRIEIKIK